jgi:manganese/zinc/iron transport system substrate-binding protein
MRYLLLALMGGWLVGCQKVEPSGPVARPDLSQRPARVLATTGMIADLASEIGGEYVQVECLIGQQDPHGYLPTAQDRGRLQNADLILYNGLHLEGKMADLFEEMRSRVRTVAVSEKIDHGKLRKGDGEVEHDPHIWFDISLWILALDRVKEALQELDPAHGERFTTNADRYRSTLQALDTEIRQQIEQLPREKRVLITSHDAFGYFGRAYGFDVHGLQGVSTATDISSKDVSELAKLIGEREIPTIFAETSVPDRSLQAVQQSVEKRWNFKVKLAETKLFSDALGEPGTPTGNYPGMIRHNVRAIVEALK